MAEHEPAPAPALAPPANVAAPALPTVAPAGPSALSAGPSALSVANVLALQRSAGNAAVASVLARDATPAAPAAPAAPAGPKEGPLTPGEINVDGGTPKPQGSWAMTSKVDAGRLYLESPEVHFDATVEVPEPADKRKIPSTTVGYIQTVESADRKGIYTRDGTPGGTPVANKHLSASDKRDVRTNMVLDPSGGIMTDPATGNPVQLQSAPAPWYDNPSYLDDQQRKTEVSTKDRTKTSFPLELDHGGKKGRLAQTAGADKFQMALSAKPGEAPAQSLKSMDWETPWASTVDPSSHKVSGTGAVWVHPSDVPLGDQKEPKGVVNKEAIDWVAITTVEDAKALGAQQCLALLPLARQYDAESYEAMATALRELNPLLGMDVAIGDGAAETVQIEAEGLRGVHTRSVSTPGVAAFHLLDFFDPNDLVGGATIKVRVTGPKGGSGAIDWAPPFPGQSVTVDGIAVSCRLGGSSMGVAAPATGLPRTAGGPPPAPPPGPPPAGPPSP